MENYIVGIVLAIVVAVTGYELATGYAGVRLGFTFHRVSRREQPLYYWGAIAIKAAVVIFIAFSMWGSLDF